MKVTVENPRDRQLIERDGLGWSADAGLWMDNEPGQRRVRRIFGRRLKG